MKHSPSMLVMFPKTPFQREVLAGLAHWQQAQGKRFMLFVPTWSSAWEEPPVKTLLDKGARYFNMHASTGRQSYNAVHNLTSSHWGPLCFQEGHQMLTASRTRGEVLRTITS